MNNILKNTKRIYNNSDSYLTAAISILSNNVYKITYYEIISGASGTLTLPTGSTINAGEFSGANCVLSEIDGSNKPTFVTPLTGGGSPVTATLNTGTGAWLKSGVTASTNVALIYSVNITAADYQNLTNFYIIDNVLLSNFSQVLNSSALNSTTSSQLAGVISDETGSGALVFGTSPTFTTGITTPLINGTSGTLQIGTTDIVNIGNKTTASQRLVRIGQDTGFADIGSVPTQTSYMGLWLNQATPSSLNYAIGSDNLGGVRVNSPSGNSLFLQVATTTKLQLAVSNTVFSLTASAFGAIGIPYTFNIPAHTATTATVNTPNFQITGSSKQWATGTVANQYWNYLTANTASFVGASTLSESVALQIDAATAGTNATITNNFALGLLAGTATIKMGNLTGSTLRAAIYLEQSSPSNANFALSSNTSSGTILNATSNLYLAIGTQNKMSFDLTSTSVVNFQTLSATGTASTSGAVTNYTFNTSTNTNQTATSNIPNFRINGANKQWATGTVPLQYFNHLTANTVSAVAASTFTNVYGLYVEAATAGTNATITNNWGIGTNGDIQIGGNQIVFNAATNAYLRNTAGNLRLSCGVGSRVAIDADGSLVGSFTSALTSITTTTLNLTGITTIAGDTTINSAAGSSLTVTSAVRNAGVRTLFTLTGSADTNQTSATEVNRILWTTGSKTWATGNITNQREFLITSPTYNFNGASTITNAYTMFVNAPTAGTNATITNNYAAGFSGRVGQVGLGNSTYFGDLCGVKDDIANRQNTAFGAQAANKVASGGLNVAMGYQSLFTNVSGNNNVAIGGFTLYQATSNSNIAVGGYALYNLTTGQSNVALGYDTGGGVTIGSNNVFIGNGITGLPSNLNNNIILATNLGVERFRYNPSQGSASLFSFSAASTTGNTASTEINMFRVNTATTTLLTGALATQRFTYLPSQTLAFTGASTATNVYGLFVEAATAGTNATITNNYAAGFGGPTITTVSTGNIILRELVSTGSGAMAIYMGTVTPSSTNYILAYDTSSVYLSAPGVNSVYIGSSQQVRIGSNFCLFSDGTNLQFNTTTGSKIGTATTQKLSFWNATPIVQPTTAVAAATVVSGTGGNVKHDDTFDGYTVEQIVSALRNIGLLA